MKDNYSILPIIKELEKIYDKIAKINGLNKIAKRPIITIQTRGSRKDVLGWYWTNKWHNNGKDISEINICAEKISERVVETLIHEMVHYHNACINVNDCNRYDYHNRHFKELAEKYGLNVKKMEGMDGIKLL